MKYHIALWIITLSGFGCNGTESPQSLDGDVAETSLHDRISQNLQLLRQLNEHYSDAQKALTDKIVTQDEKLDEFLQTEHLLLQMNEPVIGLVLEEPENRELRILARQFCRTKLTLD